LPSAIVFTPFLFGHIHHRRRRLPVVRIAFEDAMRVITEVTKVARELVCFLIEWMAVIADLSFYRVDSALYNIGNHLIVPLRNG
jgi:hypothetical protein